MSPRVARLCFPFQGKRKKNNPFHGAKNRAESRPGCGLEGVGGGECFFLGLSPALAGLGPGGVRGSIEEERTALPGDVNVS